MNYDSDGNPVDPREHQEGWDTHVRGLLNAADFSIVRLNELEWYVDEGYIDVKNDTLYSYIFECEIPLLCIVIESHAPLPMVMALLDRGADINAWTERPMPGEDELSWITPMSVAIRVGNEYVVQELLDQGVDPLSPTCWKCTITTSKDDVKLHDRPRKTMDAIRYAIDMGQFRCLGLLVRHHRLNPSSLAPYIGYVVSKMKNPPEPSRKTFGQSLSILHEVRLVYTRLDATECSLWTMKYAIQRLGWRDVSEIVARHIFAEVREEEDGDEGKEPVSKKIKKD